MLHDHGLIYHAFVALFMKTRRTPKIVISWVLLFFNGKTHVFDVCRLRKRKRVLFLNCIFVPKKNIGTSKKTTISCPKCDAKQEWHLKSTKNGQVRKLPRPLGPKGRGPWARARGRAIDQNSELGSAILTKD